MCVRAVLREILPRKHIPVSLQPRPSQRGFKAFQLTHIARAMLRQFTLFSKAFTVLLLAQLSQCSFIPLIGGKKRCVIPHTCLDERVVACVLPALEISVDEKPFDPRMPRAARIAGDIGAFGIRARAAHAGAQPAELILGELRGFIEEKHIAFLPLILEHIVFGIAIAQLDTRSPRKREYLITVAVLRP